MTVRRCEERGCKDKDGNCLTNGTDGLPIQCVGPWVEDKYFFLEQYLNASREARRKFADEGNAVFIDLFAGPGKCIIKNEKREIDSGGIRALNRNEAPFNECFYFDISKANVLALKKRSDAKSTCHVRCGDSNVLVKELVEKLLKKRYRYHFAYIDPFGPDGLKFKSLAELARLGRMDMLIHFPIGAIKRNLNHWLRKEDTILDNFLGTHIWRERIQKVGRDKSYKVMVDTFKEQLRNIGYPEEGLKLAASDGSIDSELPTVPVKNTKDVNLYVLILASKNPLGQKIWSSIIKMSPNGQRDLF